MSKETNSIHCTHGKGFNCKICYPDHKMYEVWFFGSRYEVAAFSIQQARETAMFLYNQEHDEKIPPHRINERSAVRELKEEE